MRGNSRKAAVLKSGRGAMWESQQSDVMAGVNRAQDGLVMKCSERVRKGQLAEG
jgi:hypothetical protein